MLRHCVATLAYRAAKAVSDEPPNFAEFRVADSSRTAGQILAHLGDLLDWELRCAQGDPTYVEHPPLPWKEGVKRFFDSLARFDAFLASDAPLACSPEKLFQGAIADALTHVGQISLLRRLAGAPVRGESYFRAEIQAGRVGLEQSGKRFEFD
jgi:hypothetical protein